MAGIQMSITAVVLAGLIYLYQVPQEMNLPGVTEDIYNEYDYVIVGAGAAGSVLAARLSEDNDVTVLVLEAGEEEVYTPDMELPVMAPLLLRSKHTWPDMTTPQNNSCLGMVDKKCYQPRGRGLGGGSSHNSVQYVKGNAEDYDRWEELGAKGWSYKDVLPYFIKSEGTRIPQLQNSKYHGTKGPLSIMEGGFTRYSQAWVDAGKELGWEEVDYNGEKQIGFSKSQINVLPDGTRASTAKVYLRPAMSRENLHVSVNSFVTKVVFDRSKKIAIGVEYVKNGVTQIVKAKKEVVLSAGAIASPKILMLSGIGPKKHLQKLKIPVVADLPVGDNFQDHLQTDAVALTMKPGSGMLGSDIMSLSEDLKRKFLGRSLLSAGSGVEGNAFFRSPSQPADRKAPFLQFHTFGKLHSEPYELWDIVKNGFGWTDEFFNEQVGLKGLVGKHGSHIAPCILHPYSRGTVRLSSANPFDPVELDPQYYSDPRDVRMMIDGIRVAQKVARTKALRELDAQIVERPLSACTEKYEYDTDEYWECYIRYNTLNVYHGSGTCKMGARTDPTSVVDPQLRVKGIANLRVVDFSVAPELISGNTHAPSVMIGEKGADLIRGKVTVSPVTV